LALVVLTCEARLVCLVTMVSFPLPQYCLAHGEEAGMYSWNSAQCMWKCDVCQKTAEESHCYSLQHMKRVLWATGADGTVPHEVQEPASGAWICAYSHAHGAKYHYHVRTGLAAWEPVLWLDRWCADVEAFGLDPITIVKNFGGPDVRGEEPPRAAAFSSFHVKPTYAQTRSFFGIAIFEKMGEILQQVLAESGAGQLRSKMFDDPLHVMKSMVYTDATPIGSASMLQQRHNIGMWWPSLATQYETGSWSSWCQDAAVNRWKRAWPIIDPRRVHIYFKRGRGPSSAPATSTVVIEEVFSEEPEQELLQGLDINALD
jgi:hypothetical protein